MKGDEEPFIRLSGQRVRRSLSRWDVLGLLRLLGRVRRRLVGCGLVGCRAGSFGEGFSPG